MPTLSNLQIPNGSVSSAKLTGTVSGAKFADGSVTADKLSATLNLSSKSITVADDILNVNDLPSGSVLGIYHTNGDYDYSSFPTQRVYYDIPGWTVTFTTKATNSILLIDIRSTGYATAGYNGISVGAKVNGSLLIGSGNDHWCLYGNSYGSGTTTSYNPCRHMRVNPNLSAGTSVTVQGVAGRWTASGDTYLPGYNSSYTSMASIQVVEIKP